MITFTWIIAAIAVFIFLLGTVATIVIKIQDVPNWRTVAKVMYWIIGILLFKIVIWWFVSSYKEATKEIDFVPTSR